MAQDQLSCFACAVCFSDKFIDHNDLMAWQFSYDSFARLDLVFGTQHKASEALLEQCRAGTINLP